MSSEFVSGSQPARLGRYVWGIEKKGEIKMGNGDVPAWRPLVEAAFQAGYCVWCGWHHHHAVLFNLLAAAADDFTRGVSSHLVLRFISAVLWAFVRRRPRSWVEGEEDGRLRRLGNSWDEPERTVAAEGRGRQFFFKTRLISFSKRTWSVVASL
jgi:hypothetical protein